MGAGVRRTLLAAVSAVALLATAPGWADAPAAARAGSSAPLPRHEVARLLAPPVVDPPVPGQASDHAAATRSASGSRYPYAIPRATADRPDTQDGRLVHVVYYLPSDKPDDALDTLGVLDVSVAAQNAWFAAQSGGRRWRFDTFRFDASVDGATRRVTAYDVTFVRGSKPASAVRDIDALSAEIIASGIVESGKRYLIYAAVDTGNACGEAYYPLTRALDRGADGQFAAVYLDSSPGCQARDFATSVGSPGMAETIAQQEILHNDGLVPPTAPHQCPPPAQLHVCTAGLGIVLPDADPERFDVLFPYVGVPLRDKVLDIGRDDYFAALLATPNLESSPFLTS